MKGMELPINMIVVVAIAVLVLVVVAAFFAGQLGGGTNTISLENAFSQGCNKLRATYNCDTNAAAGMKVPNYAPAGTQITAEGYNFLGTPSVCSAKGYSDAECAVACGCPRI